MAFSSEDRRKLAKISAELRRGDTLTQADFDGLLAEWEPKVAPDVPERTEHFALANPDGTETDVFGPRWAFHVFGLRHRAVHIALRTTGGLLLLQRRSPVKADWPDALDMTAAGHIPHDPDGGALPWEAGAWKEIAEEIGLREADAAEDLVEGRLLPVGEPYFTLDRDERPGIPFINAEVRQIYAATLTKTGFARLHFADREVAGLCLVTPETAWEVLVTGKIASGLRYSLPRVLDWLERR